MTGLATSGKASVSLQDDLFNPIMSKLLPLLFTLLVFSFIRKGVSPLNIIGGIVVLGLSGAYFGFL